MTLSEIYKRAKERKFYNKSFSPDEIGDIEETGEILSFSYSLDSPYSYYSSSV